MILLVEGIMLLISLVVLGLVLVTVTIGFASLLFFMAGVCAALVIDPLIKPRRPRR